MKNSYLIALILPLIMLSACGDDESLTVVSPKQISLHKGEQSQIEVISESAFIDSGLKEIILPSNLKEIASQAFYETANLQNISISRSTTVIGNKAFYNSGLTSITLHNGLNTSDTWLLPTAPA